MSSLKKHLFQTLYIVSMRVLLLLSCMSSLHVLNINLFPDLQVFCTFCEVLFFPLICHTVRILDPLAWFWFCCLWFCCFNLRILSRLVLKSLPCTTLCFLLGIKKDHEKKIMYVGSGHSEEWQHYHTRVLPHATLLLYYLSNFYGNWMSQPALHPLRRGKHSGHATLRRLGCQDRLSR